jgi:hypothetical protein
MPIGTPSPFPRSRTAAPSRTARPIAGTGRPVRIDLTSSVPFGAPAGPEWPGESTLGTETAPLSDLVDRASAQVVILRKAVDEAAGADRAVRAHNAELAQRLSQGQRFAAELDQRIARAGQAAGIVEKAAGALKALESAVTQVRAAQDAVTRSFDTKLAEQERMLEERLARQESLFEQRMARQQEVFERRIGELSAHFEETISHAMSDSEQAREAAEQTLAEHRRAIVDQVEQICAAADRQVAQVQARSSLIVDGISDRIDVLNQQSQRIGTDAQEHLDTICQRAAVILGHDPRSDFTSEPRIGSLADAAARADALVLGVDEAAIRIAALRDDAESVLRRLTEASCAASQLLLERQPHLDALRTSLDQASAQAATMQQTLEDALRQQADAAEKSSQASLVLGRQREDLAAIAEAGRYHVEQCRAAAETLRETMDQAKARVRELDHAAAAVRAQAEDMVALARDAAAIVAKAKQETATPPTIVVTAGDRSAAHA